MVVKSPSSAILSVPPRFGVPAAAAAGLAASAGFAESAGLALSAGLAGAVGAQAVASNAARVNTDVIRCASLILEPLLPCSIVHVAAPPSVPATLRLALEPRVERVADRVPQ